MADKLLDVNGLTVSVEEKEILHDINLSINKGETHVLMGCLLYTSDAADEL